MRILSLLKPKLLAAQDQSDCFTTDGYTVSFNGDCDVCLPYCAALCCTIFKFVALTEEEAASGRYHLIEARAGCGCEVCSEMREKGLRYSLAKKADGSCVYLTEAGRCGIYEERPAACRRFNCKDMVLPLQTEM
ncbi:MAG TPA: YkgJ family cysteine cluster protein [Chloroflexia bacterium]|nr:YkgJ family cysteine cluster protein [Chloroflexia bacterium]